MNSPPDVPYPAPDQEETKLAIVTIAVRIPKDKSVSSVYAIDTKYGYFQDVIDYSVLEEDDNGNLRTPW